jgi:hypothetical protein
VFAATGTGAEAAGGEAAGASALFSPLLQAATDTTDTIPAHIQRNSLDTVITCSFLLSAGDSEMFAHNSHVLYLSHTSA